MYKFQWQLPVSTTNIYIWCTCCGENGSLHHLTTVFLINNVLQSSKAASVTDATVDIKNNKCLNYLFPPTLYTMYMAWWKQELTNVTQEWICFLNNIILGITAANGTGAAIYIKSLAAACLHHQHTQCACCGENRSMAHHLDTNMFNAQ